MKKQLIISILSFSMILPNLALAQTKLLLKNKEKLRQINQENSNNDSITRDVTPIEQRTIPGQYRGQKIDPIKYRDKKQRKLSDLRLYTAFGIRGTIIQDIEYDSSSYTSTDAVGNVNTISGGRYANNKLSFDTAFGVNAAIGIYLDKLRIEFEYAQAKSDIAGLDNSDSLLSITSTKINNASSTNADRKNTVVDPEIFHVDVTNYMLNFIMDNSSPYSKLSPYFGAGIGVVNAEFFPDGVSKINDEVVADGDSSDSAIAFQTILGLQYKVTDFTSLYLDYKFLLTNGLEYQIGAADAVGINVFKVEHDFRTHNISMGFRVNF